MGLSPKTSSTWLRVPAMSVCYSWGCQSCNPCPNALPFTLSWTQVVRDVTLLAGREVKRIGFQFYNDREYLSSLLLDGVSLQVCR
jgi:hypothetical protein